MYTLEDALYVINKLGIVLDKFSIKDFLTGLNIEREHGLINPITNVTNDNLLITGKIALAHLMEFPNYYNEVYGLPVFERELKKRLND